VFLRRHSIHITISLNYQQLAWFVQPFVLFLFHILRQFSAHCHFSVVFMTRTVSKVVMSHFLKLSLQPSFAATATMYSCVSVCASVCICVSVCASVCICVCICVYLCINVQLCICLHVCVSVCVFVCTYVCAQQLTSLIDSSF